MRIPRPSRFPIPALVLFLPSIEAALTFNCDHVRVDHQSWDLSPLGGPKSVIWTHEHPPSYTKTTFTIDLCKKLEKIGPKNETCENGSRVCAIERLFNPIEHKNTTHGVIPIAGEFGPTTGGSLDPKWTRLKSSSAPDDRGKEGLRLEMGGGKYKEEEDGKMHDQKAVVEFLCDKSTEERPRALSRRDDEEEGDEKDKEAEETDDGEGGKLKFLNYELVGHSQVHVLSLQWNTKYACENAKVDGKGGGHWGFFTWFIIIIFLAIAAYLVFGSWLNYNRYSARGWDLVPHSETLRDIPYIFKDWMRRVVSTVQGGGSRGGYSAV